MNFTASNLFRSVLPVLCNILKFIRLTSMYLTEEDRWALIAVLGSLMMKTLNYNERLQVDVLKRGDFKDEDLREFSRNLFLESEVYRLLCFRLKDYDKLTKAKKRTLYKDLCKVPILKWLDQTWYQWKQPKEVLRVPEIVKL